MITYLRRKRHSISSYIIMGLCGIATLYVFAASYETVFNRDLPLVQAVSTVNIQALSRTLNDYKQVDQGAIGNYGFPQYLKLPAQDARMAVVPGIEVEGKFLARAAAAHYFMTSDGKSGNIGNLVVYFEKSWRTDDRIEEMKAGDNIFLDTDRDWRYFYRIDTVNTIEDGRQYVARGAQTTQLILVGVDKAANRLVIAQASLVNVQSVRL